MSFPQGKSPPWLPPIEARVPLLVVRRHWLPLALDFAVPTLIVTAVLAAVGLVGPPNAQTVVIVLAVAAFWAVIVCARWRVTSFTLTPRTIVFRRGLIDRSCWVVALEAVQVVTTRESLLGTVLGYGTVGLCLTSGHRERLSGVPDPRVVRDRIFSARLDRTP